MKRLKTPAIGQRFQGSLRHYHRAAQPLSTWEAWSEVKAPVIRRRSVMAALQLVIGILLVAGVLVMLRKVGF